MELASENQLFQRSTLGVLFFFHVDARIMMLVKCFINGESNEGFLLRGVFIL